MDRNIDNNPFTNRGLVALIGILLLAGLYASSLYSYLLFHSLIELFSIVTAFVIFVIAWHTRRVQDNQYLLLIGIASLSTGSIELAHTLAYKGMGVFAGRTADLPTQLWIGFRYVFSISVLLAPLFIKRRFNPLKVLAVYGAVTMAALYAVFTARFPSCFMEGSGLTPFKIYSEYVIAFIFAAGLGLLIQNRKSFDPTVFGLMAGSIVLSIASELAFTKYVSVFGAANMIGHFFLLASMALIYRALVITGIVEPSSLLFRNLKRSEEAIRESEERYRTLVELSPDAITVHSNGVWRYVNPAGLALFGASLPEEIVGTPVLDRIHPDDRAVVAERIREVENAAGFAGLREIRMLRMDGTVLDVESTAARASYRGSPAIQVIIRDITERRKTERALEKIRTGLSAMIEKVPIVTLLVDRDRRVRKANVAAASFAGASEAEMAGLRAGEAIHCVHSLDDPKGCGFGPSCPACPVRAAVMDAFERGTHLQGREACLSVVRGGRQDDRTVALTTTPVSIEDEQLTLVCIDDITERKKTEESLRKSLRRFELLSQTAGELLQEPDPQTMVDALCRRVMEHLDCHAFFNYIVDEKTGKLHLNASAGIPEEKARKIEWLDYGVAVCGCVARDGRRIVAEHIPTTPDERTDLVRSYGITAYACHPMLGPSGKVIGTLSFGTRSRETFTGDDLSLMKAVADQVAVAMTRMRDDREIRDLNGELKKHVHLLEAANRELEAFAYSVSHDLRAPLRSIDGFTYAVLEEYGDRLDEAGRGYLDRVRRSTTKMGELIDALLQLSRLSRGELNRTMVDLSSLARTAVDDLRKQEPGRAVEFVIAGDITADGDAIMLRAVVENLLSNAWKFTSKTEQVRIEFGVLRRGFRERSSKTPHSEFLSPGSQLVYYVRDNGAGFDMAYGRKLFTAFQRLHGAEEFPGIGIGLATVQRIIHRHGGKIWAKGEMGKGATFYFTL